MTRITAHSQRPSHPVLPSQTSSLTATSTSTPHRHLQRTFNTGLVITALKKCPRSGPNNPLQPHLLPRYPPYPSRDYRARNALKTFMTSCLLWGVAGTQEVWEVAPAGTSYSYKDDSDNTEDEWSTSARVWIDLWTKPQHRHSRSSKHLGLTVPKLESLMAGIMNTSRKGGYGSHLGSCSNRPGKRRS